MNDSPVITRVTPDRFDQITQRLAEITEASAECYSILSQTKSLHAFASEMLRTRLDAVRVDIGLAVSNPDALFFNRLDEDGVLDSITMTELLIKAMSNGPSIAKASDAAFYLRHDSLDHGDALTAEQGRQLQAVLDEVTPVLSSAYAQHLSESWSSDVAHPADPERLEPAINVLKEQKCNALTSEIALCGVVQKVNAEEQERLTLAVANDSTDGLFALSWLVSDGNPVGVDSAYVVSESAQSDSEPAGVVFLVMPSRGIERFESVALLREALSKRLEGPEFDRDLLQLMGLSDQARLAAGVKVEPDDWRFTAMSEPLLGAHVEAMKNRQMEDFRFLLQRENSGANAASFHTDLERVRACSHIDDAMGRRFNALTIEMTELAQPHWRKYAEPHRQEHLIALEKAHHARKKRVEALLQGVENLEHFAREQITRYIRHHLGCFIDPDQVHITLRDRLTLGKNDDLNMTYRKSLVEYALLGLPAVGGQMEISPAPEHLHAAFSDGFVRKMITDLDLHRGYEAALRACYADEQCLRAMTHYRDSAIALGAWAGVMQGHIAEDRSHDLIHLIRGDVPKEGAEQSMGSLCLTKTESPFRDLIVFQEKTESDEHYVLYAPGAPQGQDFFEFGSWRQLCFEVGKWLETESGRSYVHDQLCRPGERGMTDAVLDEVQNKPTLWGPESCIFVRGTGENYETNLNALVSQKALRLVDAMKESLIPMNHDKYHENRANLSLMEARFDGLSAEFANLSSGLVPFRDFVHAQTSEIFNKYLRENGYMRSLDPDTLYVGLGRPYQETPDFSEHTELHTLTDLMMFGNEEILSYRPHIHLYSSVGQDLTQLRGEFIRFMDHQINEADLGARYMDFLKTEFLGRQSPFYSRRKAIMAQRVMYDMMRRSLEAFLGGRISESQYSWVRKTIAELDPNARDRQRNTTSCVSAFKIADQIIEGVYIFRDFSKNDPDYNLLYTPDSPDGISYRRLTNYADLLASAAMRSYFYGRVAYIGQRLVGTYIDDLLRGKKPDPEDVRIVNRPEARIIDAGQIYGDMIGRMIADIDDMVETLTEKRLALALCIINWTGTLVLLPFPVASFVWGVAFTVITIVEAVDAYSAGDRATALPLILSSVWGIFSGGDNFRSLVTGGTTLATMLGTRAGLWAWHKLDLGRTLPGIG